MVLTEIVVSLMILTFVLSQLWSLRRDYFVSDIRQLRDELFDYIWQNNLSFEDPNYQSACQLFDKLIDNKWTTFSFLVLMFLNLRYNNHSINEERLPSDLSKKIDTITNEAVTRFVRFLFLERILKTIVKITGWELKINQVFNCM